jgi:tol-pal system protein YbgF
MKIKFVILGISFFATSYVYANAPVVDLSQSQNSPVATSEISQPLVNVTESGPPESLNNLPLNDRVIRLEQQVNNFAQMNMPSRVDQLQQQVQQLQGQLETQSHELQQIEAQQKNFYQDLDQRLAQMKSGTPASPQNSTVTNKTPNIVPTQNDQAEYQAAFSLLQNKKYDEAITAMQNYLTHYPNGQYAANAHYWLGEIYSLQNKSNLASQEFQTIINKYPNDQKVPDAMLKLAFISDAAGQHAEAKQQLKKIVKQYPGTPAAQLASMKLKNG